MGSLDSGTVLNDEHRDARSTVHCLEARACEGIGIKGGTGERRRRTYREPVIETHDGRGTDVRLFSGS